MQGRRLTRLALVLLLLGAAVSVALALTHQHVWPVSAQQQARYTAVARYVREHTGPEARIFVWGNSPEIYLYAKRRMATRYMSVNYQTGHVWGTPANDLGGTPDVANVPAESWTKLMADLDRNRPALIIDAAAGKLGKMDAEPIARHPAMADLLRKHYEWAATEMGVPIYRRRGLDGGVVR